MTVGKRSVPLILAISLGLTAQIAPSAFAQSGSNSGSSNVSATAPTTASAALPAPAVPPAATAATAAANPPAAEKKTGEVVATGQEAAAASAVAVPPAVAVLSSTAPTVPIFIDNDDENAKAEIQETYKWEELPDTPGATKITTGARFPVRVVSELSSKTCKVGDPVEGQVRVDVRIGGKMIAPKGTRVIGHVFNVMPARRMLIAETSIHRWWRANGEIGVQFDEIITKDGEHIPLEAKPAQMPRIVVNKAEGRIMGVNAKGEVASPLSIQLKEQAIHYAIRGAASAAGVFSMGAVPVAYAIVGAISPSFAYMHPVGRNVNHRRLKGAAMGFVNGLPGGFLISDSIIKGSEASIKPGDEFLVEFKQDFTGEPAGDAEMLGGGSKAVHAELVGKNKDEKDKKK